MSSSVIGGRGREVGTTSSGLQSGTGSNVIPLPRKASDASTREPAINDMWRDLLLRQSIRNDFKLSIEAAVERAVAISLAARHFPASQSAFDAVYIAELEPDEIGERDVPRIRALSRITDLSSTISFADGWDD